MRLRLPRRQRGRTGLARITYFALLSEPHAGETRYRPTALYGFVADGRWMTGTFRGELIDALRVADIGGRYEMALRPGARVPVRYDARRPEVSRLVLRRRRPRRSLGVLRRLMAFSLPVSLGR